MLQRLLLLICVPVLSVSLGCVDYLSSTEDFDNVLTVREPGRSFADLTTYALVDEVIDLGPILGEDSRPVDHSFDALILDTISGNMNSLGWTQVEHTPPDDPDDGPMLDESDVLLIVGVVATDNWLWGSYYPWFGYDPYFWYYPIPPRPINYPTGTIIVTMLKPDERTTDDLGNEVIPVVWVGAIRGLLESSRSNTATRIERLVTQAFTQSPYLDISGESP